jgi:hypothetical protein
MGYRRCWPSQLPAQAAPEEAEAPHDHFGLTCFKEWKQTKKKPKKSTMDTHPKKSLATNQKEMHNMPMRTRAAMLKIIFHSY